MIRFLVLGFLLLPSVLFAQKIDNMVSFRNIESDKYFRINYDNDYFASSDENYTQGYSFELVTPSLMYNPLNILFTKRENNKLKYGLSIEHIGYTPGDFSTREIQYGDRPFAAAIMLKSFLIATDTIKKSRLISSLNLGAIGPVAFGEEMQTAIHKAIGGTLPKGWPNQIQNDVVINYELSYEKQIVRYRNLFSMQTSTGLQLGTLFTNANVGLSTVFGIINAPYSSVNKQSKFQIYFYSQPKFMLVGYDATLQGGLFNESPYTIRAENIERFKYEYNFGLVIQTSKLYFEYSRSVITKEFESGSSAYWGGVKVGFRI